MPFRRRRRHPDPVIVEQQRIVAPLARVEERLMDLGSNLDNLAAGISDVAMRMREMAEQVTGRAEGGGDD